RQMMVRQPPNLLVTTPESLYLYLTAERSRATLETVHTVIVDEIHALARDKRGSHLTLSLERLAAVAAQRPLRVGLSATVRPHELGERLGEDEVAAHHGWLSRERRQRVEHRLRAGDLRALVATASLELGIDIGPVELVCQIGSPHSIATFLQRVGRANHHRTG